LVAVTVTSSSSAFAPEPAALCPAPIDAENANANPAPSCAARALCGFHEIGWHLILWTKGTPGFQNVNTNTIRQYF
jgi:hypothetical protein